MLLVLNSIIPFLIIVAWLVFLIVAELSKQVKTLSGMILTQVFYILNGRKYLISLELIIEMQMEPL